MSEEEEGAEDGWDLAACADAWRRAAVLVSAALGGVRGRDAADARRIAVLAAARAQAVAEDARWGPAALARCHDAQEADARALLALLHRIAEAAEAAPSASHNSAAEAAQPTSAPAPEDPQPTVATVHWLEDRVESSGDESAGEDPDYIDVASEYA